MALFTFGEDIPRDGKKNSSPARRYLGVYTDFQKENHRDSPGLVVGKRMAGERLSEPDQSPGSVFKQAEPEFRR